MMLTLLVLIAVSTLELAIRASFPAKVRRVMAVVVGVGLLGGTVLLVLNRPAVWTILIALLSLYRIVNLLRIIQDHHHSEYLQHIAWRSSCWLIMYQLGVVLITLGSDRLKVSNTAWEYLLLVFQLIIVAIIIASTNRHIRTTRAPILETSYVDRDLPTLSVLIPARNETDDLDACLQTLVKSTYPKLEVLVLDDCSQTTRTSEIIRGFAHDGVRFIAGLAPPDQWLAKNFAYEQLSNEANGELLLFCGVDARFTSDSLRALVETMLQKKKAMLSIVPENSLPQQHSLTALLMQPCRYAWELSLPRRLLIRPPVLSTCWLITQAQFQAAGTFKAVARSVGPERYFARFCAVHQDGYSFLCSNQQLSVSSSKSLVEQRATAIRTRYPQLHRQLEKAALVTLTELTVLILPFVLLIASIAVENGLAEFLTFITCLLLIIFYVRIVSLTYRKFLWRSLYLEPIAAFYDIGLLNYSLWQYEFGEVIWKDRNICIPVMRVIQSFPKLP